MNAWGQGVGTFAADGQLLDVFYKALALGDSVGPESKVERRDDMRRVTLRSLRVQVEDVLAPPTSPEDCYLRLHLLSHCLVRPNEINLDGIFELLPIVCWTSLGPVATDDAPELRLRMLEAGRHVEVRSVDRFPRMVDYVVPPDVRIADGDRVRLGAHLAPGTTVMHEGFVNFNAGTLGPVMVEGRISQGVVVEAGSDIGGGASTMGTLSGGGRERVRIGQRCLLGANAGLGIALGDDCVVEAGLYLTAGTVVTLPDGTTAKARELSGRSQMLYRRNSRTGAVEGLQRSGSRSGLNTSLHTPS